MSDEEKRSSVGARRNPDTETAVLDAAEALIAESGYGTLTMEAVAKRARAGKATLYRWWPSKAHLLLALYSRAKQDIPTPDTGSLRLDLKTYFAGMMARLRGDGGMPAQGPYLCLLIAEAQIDRTVARALQAERHERWHHIDGMVLRAHARGELNPALTAERAEQKIISMLWYLLLNDQLPAADQVPGLVDDILAGMLAGDRGRD